MIVVRASIASHDGNEHGHLSLDGFEVGFDMNVMRMKDTDDEETRSSVPHFYVVGEDGMSGCRDVGICALRRGLTISP